MLGSGWLRWSYIEVRDAGTGRCHNSLETLPKRSVGLLLGTAPKKENGQENLFFKYRIEAAAALWHAGKVEKLLASGSTDGEHYDEPEAMARALVEQGVPRDAILTDKLGKRTIHSVVRAKDHFGYEAVTIISQPFHNHRAIRLSEHAGLDAIGYNARAVEGGDGLVIQWREHLARVKMRLDLHLWDTIGQIRTELGQTQDPELSSRATSEAK